MKKRIFYLVMAIICILAIVLGGCSSKDPKLAFKGKVIKYMAVAEPISDFIRDSIIPEFTKETGIIVEMDTTDYAKLHDKQVLELISGKYDVYQVDQMWITKYVKNGWLADLGKYVEKYEIPIDNYYDSLLNICRGEGKLAVLPLSAIPVNFYYNKTMLSKEGLSAPDTWDDVLKNAKALTKDLDGDGNIDQWGIGIRGERGNPITWTFLPIFWSYGAEIFNEKMEPVYNSPEAVAALDFFKELNQYSPPGWHSAQDVAALMQQGKSAQMALMAVYNGSMDDPAQSKVVNEIEFLDMPKGPTGNRISILGLWTIGIAEKSKNKDAAVQFLKYLSEIDVAKKMAFSGTVSPTMPKVFEDPEAPRYYSIMGSVLNYVKAPPLIPEAEEWFNSFGTALQEALSGEKTSQQALDDSVRHIRDILDKAGYYK
jgi:multiple sugar transport system substrate-binding protein